MKVRKGGRVRASNTLYAGRAEGEAVRPRAEAAPDEELDFATRLETGNGVQARL